MAKSNGLFSETMAAIREENRLRLMASWLEPRPEPDSYLTEILVVLLVTAVAILIAALLL